MLSQINIVITGPCLTQTLPRGLFVEGSFDNIIIKHYIFLKPVCLRIHESLNSEYPGGCLGLARREKSRREARGGSRWRWNYKRWIWVENWVSVPCIGRRCYSRPLWGENGLGRTWRCIVCKWTLAAVLCHRLGPPTDLGQHSGATEPICGNQSFKTFLILITIIVIRGSVRGVEFQRDPSLTCSCSRLTTDYVTTFSLSSSSSSSPPTSPLCPSSLSQVGWLFNHHHHHHPQYYKLPVAAVNRWHGIRSPHEKVLASALKFCPRTCLLYEIVYVQNSLNIKSFFTAGGGCSTSHWKHGKGFSATSWGDFSSRATTAFSARLPLLQREQKFHPDFLRLENHKRQTSASPEKERNVAGQLPQCWERSIRFQGHVIVISDYRQRHYFWSMVGLFHTQELVEGLILVGSQKSIF